MQLQLSLNVADRLHEALLVHGEPLDAVEAACLLLASPKAPARLCGQILDALVRHDRRFCWHMTATPQISLNRWEMADPDLAEIPFVALDLETTGARAGTGKITEIGAVRIEGLREVGHFSTLVNPQRPIPPIITHLTGITEEMVADSPRIEKVIPDLLEFLEGAVVVAHNAAFDVGFLNYELRRLKGQRLGEGAIDTLPLARALAPGLPNYRLRTVAEALDAPVLACHRALADAQAAAHVFITLVGRLQEHGVSRLEELRAYLNPSSRSGMDKLRLTRDLPRRPGTYRFLDRDDRIVYVGRADKLGEEVRAHFVPGSDRNRRMRQAVRLVERIDWDEAPTPLEALVHEHRLILEHRPTCNMYGTRPETYAYIKAGGAGPGLNLFASSRAPKWLAAQESRARPARGPLVMGPFRGRARVQAALDLLHHCYPVRRCPRRPNDRPCARAGKNQCLAPCSNDIRTRREHDALVLTILDWLAGRDDTDLPDPFERANDMIRDLSRQRRHDEAQKIKEASEHLLTIRRSYASLAEAQRLRFAILWPHTSNGDGPSVRLNLIWNGNLQDPVSFHPAQAEESIRTALDSIRDASRDHQSDATASLVAVQQEDLDLLLALRHWVHETDRTLKVSLPGPGADTSDWEETKMRLVEEARSLLVPGSAPLGRAYSAT